MRSGDDACTRVSSGPPFYRRPEAVAVNGDLRRVITAVPWMCRGITGLGSAVEVHRSHLGANRAGIWCYGRVRQNGAARARRRQGARSVLAGPRRRCHGRALACMRPRGEQRGVGRRRTALSRRSVPCWLLRGFGRRKTCGRGRPRAPPTPGRRQERVRGCWPGRRSRVQRAKRTVYA